MAEQRVAMFGGTFDPVHIGHLRSAVELREALGLERVHMVVNRLPPHRATPGVSAEDRLALVKAGVGDTEGLYVDAREIEREGPSWSALTLASLRQEYGAEARLFMAIGMDAYRHLAEWHNPAELFELAHIVVIERPGSDFTESDELQALIEPHRVSSIDELMAHPYGGFYHLPLPSPISVSATELRQRLEQGLSIRYLVPPDVEALIAQRYLYEDMASKLV